MATRPIFWVETASADSSVRGSRRLRKCGAVSGVMKGAVDDENQVELGRLGQAGVIDVPVDVDAGVARQIRIEPAGPNAPFGATDPPWTPAAAEQIAALRAADKNGKPHNVFIDCLPEGMPSSVMMTQAAFEVLFTPGRVPILGEFDGNRLRRIYTDGRGRPDDPDLTFNGYSIGHWEQDTLVIDTMGILPETFLALGQAVALPNNGDMRIVEHLRLTAPDVLTDDLEITAPHMLTGVWKTSRSFRRRRGSDIVEASCRQGDFTESHDARGNAIFKPLSHDEAGDPLPTPP